MKRNKRLTLRVKIFLLFFCSALLTAAIVLALMSLVRHVYHTGSPDMQRLIRSAMYNYNLEIPMIIVTSLVFFCLLLLLFSYRHIRYISTIARLVSMMQVEQLDIRIPIETRDEFGELAGNINEMAERIQSFVSTREQENKLKYDLITGLSHDLRTPMTSILGYIDLIKSRPELSAEQRGRYIDIIQAKSNRMQQMINDLFEYTRVSSPAFMMKKERIDLCELVRQCADTFMPILEKEDAILRMHLPDEPLLIKADGELMMRAVENILSNACKYGLDEKRIDIAVKSNGTIADISITNYGSIIPSGDMMHIFESYYRLEAGENDRQPGTGLGLATAKAIVSGHGGSISAQSDYDGTVFRIELPVDQSL